MRKEIVKRIVCSLLTLVLVIGGKVPVFADSDEQNNLNVLADEIIEIEQVIDMEGGLSTTYSNLDVFVERVKNQYSEIDDYDVAVFLMEYTKQENSDLPEELVLEFLDYEFITSYTSYVYLDEEGNPHNMNSSIMPLANFTHESGVMKFVTDYAKNKTVGTEKYYSVWSRATWIKYPALALQDSFALGHTAAYDNDALVYASVSQTFECKMGCSKMTSRNREVRKTNPKDGDLVLTQGACAPYIKFTPISPRCDYCGGTAGTTYAKDYYFSTYLKYGIVADESVNIQAGYGHKTVTLGDISVSIGNKGEPSFSVNGVKKHVTPYIAEAVLVNYNK